jgi:hypothetical protein
MISEASGRRRNVSENRIDQGVEMINTEQLANQSRVHRPDDTTKADPEPRNASSNG